MTSFNPFEIFKIMSPKMIFDGFTYKRKAAKAVIKAENPELNGVALSRAVRSRIQETPPGICEQSAFTYIDTLRSENHDGDVFLINEDRIIRIQALAESIIQLRVGESKDFEEPHSYAVIHSESEMAAQFDEIETDESTVSLTSGGLQIKISLKEGNFSISHGGIGLIDSGKIGWIEGQNRINWVSEYSAPATQHGLGEQAFDFDLTGRSYKLCNTDPAGYNRGDQPINLNMPVIFSMVNGKALLFFFDNPYLSWFDLGCDDPNQWEFQAVDGEMRMYIMAGTPEEVMRSYTHLVGRIKMPPVWALGLHQSRWSYYPQERVEKLISDFREKRIPCDVIHFDIHYMDGYRCFTWDNERFPDFPGLINKLHNQGFKGLSMIDPGIKIDPGYKIYDEGIDGGHFISHADGTPFAGPVWPGYCHFPDFTKPASRLWWGECYRELLDIGMDAFWNDMNEIAIITTETGSHVPDEVQFDDEGRGSDYAEMHSQYGMQMSRASVEGLQRLQPTKRPLILTRSGWAGVHRYAMHWTGDNASTFDHLKLSLSMVMNLGLCGISMTGPDLGGFAGEPSPELFARWIEAGVFTPFFRIHTIAGSPDQEPWSFGEEVEEISRKYINLRYQLLPYIYTATWQSSSTGKPIMRPILFDFPGSAAGASIDQYLFGDAFMVAPVVEEGTTSRIIEFPPGEWLDFWTGATHRGEETIRVDAPLHHLPLYVKSGAVIPMYPVQQYIGEKKIDTLTLKLYPGSKGLVSHLYIDDGVTPDYSASEMHKVYSYEYKRNEDGFSVSQSIQTGSFSPEWYQIDLHLIGIDNSASIQINGLKSYTSEIRENGEMVIQFPFQDRWTLNAVTRK